MAENTVAIDQPQRNTRRASTSDVISVPQACEILGIHRNTLYKLIEAEQIPAFRLVKGGRWKFRKGELQQWLEDQAARRFL
jgi:excisionase family DNA binding protein